MSVPADYITPILQRVYDLHATSTFAAAVTWREKVLPANRIKRLEFSPWKSTKPVGRASPSENAEADFRLDRSGAMPGFKSPTVFCASAGGQRPLVGEQHVFQIILNHLGSSYANAMLIQALTRAIIVHAGEKLMLDGENPISYVAGVADPISRYRDKYNGNDRPASFTQTIEIPVNVILRASDLAG